VPVKLGSILLLNLALTVGWVALQTTQDASDFLVGFAISFVLLALAHREYGRRVTAACGFVIFLVWSIVKSSLQVAGLILAPQPKLDQGIVAIPLEVTSDFEVAVLATSITLTPGTLSVDVGQDASGQRVLYVHNLVTSDPEAMRRDIKQQFEQRILRFTRGRAET
jgi:multicomponent Na+:H+ antiporter subunit E